MGRIWVAVICVLLLVAMAAGAMFFATVGSSMVSNGLANLASRSGPEVALTLYRWSVSANPYDAAHRLALYDLYLRRDEADIAQALLETGIEGGDGESPVEMDVRDERHGRCGNDSLERGGRGFVRHGEAHDFASGGMEAAYLLERGFHVARVGVGHALHDHGRAAADEHGAELQLSCSASMRSVHAFSFTLCRWCIASHV